MHALHLNIECAAGLAGRAARSFWYLGAVPGQDLPFPACQGDLLLDGTLKFTCK